MSEENKETRCPFCGVEMDVVAELKNDEGEQRTFYRCESRDCSLRINSVTLEHQAIAGAWCFKEMDRIRARMTAKALDEGIMMATVQTYHTENSILERKFEVAKGMFIALHSEHTSDDVKRSEKRFNEIIEKHFEKPALPRTGDYVCTQCSKSFETLTYLSDHGSCLPWWEVKGIH